MINIFMMHINRPQGQVYLSSAYRSVRHHSFSKNRYVPTTNATFSITSHNNTTYTSPRLNINDELLQKRKANHLQSQVNKRENVNNEIAKRNKILYKRLNSQKSLYSQQSLSKSTVSIRSISQNSSRSSLKKAEQTNKKKVTQLRLQKFKQKIKLQPQNIDNIQKKQIDQFKNLFKRDNLVPVTTRQRCISEKVPNINQFNIGFTKAKPSLPNNGHQLEMGNLLHKIAQQFYLPAPKTARTNKNNKRKY